MIDRTTTAIGAAFGRQGVTPAIAQFDIAIAKFLNAGESIECGYERMRIAAEKLPGRGGQNGSAGNGETITDQSRQPVEGAREQRAAQRAVTSAKVEAAVRHIVTSIFNRTRTSDGRAWGDVGAHEWAGMDRDGTVARAIMDYLGPLNDKQRFKPLRDLMTEDQFDLVLTRVERNNRAV